MDALLEEYGMVIDVSTIQPFEMVRDMHSFYTSEAARAAVKLAEHKASRRTLKRTISTRTASLMGSQTGTKWRASAEIERQPEIRRLNRALDFTENLIEMMTEIKENYFKYADSLSREITARTKERDAYYGRAGSGR